MAKAGRKKKEEVEQSLNDVKSTKEECTEEFLQHVKTLEEDGIIPDTIIGGTVEIIVPNFANVSKSEEEKAVEELDVILEEKKDDLQQIEKMPEVEFLNQSQLSDMAIKWEKYIAMYKFTPERFLERYPNHPNKRFIEEIIAFKKS